MFRHTVILLTTICTSFLFADYASTVTTPGGTSVSVLVRTPDLTSAQKTAINNQFKSAYPGATYLGGSTKKYNCHSYAWHQQSTSNGYWMNNPSPYWGDGSYSNVTALSTNDKIIYANSSNVISHSAVYKGGIEMISKWGQAPLFRHNFNDCPYWANGDRKLFVFRRN